MHGMCSYVCLVMFEYFDVGSHFVSVCLCVCEYSFKHVSGSM